MGLQRFATTAAAGVLLLAGTASCSDDGPQTGTVDDPPAAEQEPGNDANGNDDADGNVGDGSEEDGNGDTPSDNGDQPEDDPTQYETAEDMPEELLQAEMEAFVGEFLEESNRAGNSGDTSAARSMAEDGCTVCHQQLDNIEKDYAAGHRWVGGEFSEEFELEIVAVEGNKIEIHVRGNYDSLQVVDQDGDEVNSYDASDFFYYLGVDRTSDGTYIIVAGENYT